MHDQIEAFRLAARVAHLNVPGFATRSQISSLFGKLHNTDSRLESRDFRLQSVSSLVGREIQSFSDLSKGEISLLIDEPCLIDLLLSAERVYAPE